MEKYFVSCIDPDKKVGAMQFECEPDEVEEKSEKLCPQLANFRAYPVTQFDEKMPIDEFVPSSKMKELGY